VNVGDTATVDSTLSRGDVDVGMVVSGVTPLPLAAVHNYDVTALSLLRAGADHSHMTPWGTALDVARRLEGECHLKTPHVQCLLEDIVAGKETLSATQGGRPGSTCVHLGLSLGPVRRFCPMGLTLL
jgi:hypothetical protein